MSDSSGNRRGFHPGYIVGAVLIISGVDLIVFTSIFDELPWYVSIIGAAGIAVGAGACAMTWSKQQEAAKLAGDVTCASCGQSAPSAASFCPHCGKPV